MPRITDVVKHLIIINVLVYFGSSLILGDPDIGVATRLIENPDADNFMAWGSRILAVFYPSSPYFQPYQIVTHMFMHGNLTHILFNMYGLFLFGSALEATWGPRRFFVFYFFTGFGALLLNFFVQWLQFSGAEGLPWEAHVPMLGASGAVFGLLAGFGMTYPNNVISLLFPPISLKAKYFVLIYGAIELFLGVGRFNTGIAHFAHLGGAIFGVLIILYWRRFGTNL